jgi:hypothetical protein
VGFDPGVELVADRAQIQIVFEGFESGFHFGELDVKVPKFGGLGLWHIGSQQVAAFPARGQFLPPKLIKSQLPVKFASQPTRTPLPGSV